MAVIGGAQSAFDKLFSGTQVVHDPRLMPRWDVLDTENKFYYNENEAHYYPGNVGYFTMAARHGASVLVRNTTSYVTVVDLSGGAGVMSFAFGPYPYEEGMSGDWGTTITWKFTIDGVVTEVPVYPRRPAAWGSAPRYRACLGGPARTDETIRHRKIISDAGAPAGSGTLSHHHSGSEFTVPLPTTALSGAGGPTPLLGWTDSFKVEVKSSVATMDVSWTQNQSGVIYLAL